MLLCLIPILSGLYIWFILLGLIFTYDLIILLWLLKIEIPKYKNDKPDYDAIWFEG